ncbi:MAG: hypothetical protein AAF849_03455 [Bacteroidota bacterium]
MVYNLKENIKHHIDSIMDVSFLEAIRTILTTKYPVPTSSQQSSYEAWVNLTAQYVAIEEAELDVETIYQNRTKEDERPLDFN